MPMLITAKSRRTRREFMQTEESKTRKKPGKKPSPKKITVSEKRIEEIAKKAAANTISKINKRQEALVDESFEEQPETGEESPLAGLFSGAEETDQDDNDFSELIANREQNQENPEEEMGDFDIFEFGQREASRRGDMPKFRIYRSGEFLCVKYGQYSYERLQKDYKGGHYKIYAYSNVSNKYLKAQSKMIADPILPDAPTPEQVQQSSGNNVAEMIMAMKDVFGVKVQGEAEEIRAKTDNTATQMTMMMQMMQQQFQMQMQMVQQQSKESQRMMELMVTLNASKKEDKGLGTLELLALLEKSKSKGASEFKELFGMAKELAEEMRSDSGGGDDEKTGIIDSLVKNFGPLITSIAASQGAVPQAPQAPQAQAPRINPQIAASVPTRPLPQAAVVQKTEPIVQPREGIPQVINAAPRAPGPLGLTKIEEPEEDDTEDEEWDEEIELESDLNDGESYVELPQESVPLEAKKEEGLVKENKKGDDTVNEVQERVMKLLAGDLVRAALIKSDIGQVAKTSFTKLKKDGISPKMILENFSEVSILKAASEKGLPPQYEPMLKEFYANIETLAKRDLSIN